MSSLQIFGLIAIIVVLSLLTMLNEIEKKRLRNFHKKVWEERDVLFKDIFKDGRRTIDIDGTIYSTYTRSFKEQLLQRAVWLACTAHCKELNTQRKDGWIYSCRKINYTKVPGSIYDYSVTLRAEKKNYC